MDETTLTLDAPLRACWMKVGQQKRIPATRPGFKQKRPVFGGYNWLRDQISWITAETKNSLHCIRFLEHLLIRQYPTGRVVLVMDNASDHKRAPALAALSLFEHRVMVIWLPTYCSDLNPIERFWRHLKDLACADRLQSGIENVMDTANKVLTEQNDLNSRLRFHVSKDL